MKKSVRAFVPAILMTLLAACAVSLTSCKKKEAAAEEAPVETPQAAEAPAPQAEESAPAVTETASSGIQFDFKPLSGDYHTDAHAAYLKDPFAFKAFEKNDSPAKSYKLVASNEAQLYGADAFSFEKKNAEYDGDDTVRATLKDPENVKGEPIPIGTILEYKDERIRSGGDEWYETSYGFFLFQDNYNWFYKVSWGGKEGYVFGADLYNVYFNAEDYATLQMYSQLYQSGGKLEDFYAYAGTKPLAPGVQESLENARLAIQKTTPGSIWLRTDDLIDAYQDIPKTTPMFVTTDLFSHSQHRIFDTLLQDTEENYFAPRLLTLTQHLIAALSERTDVPDDIKVKAVAYFQVPELVLRSAPQKVPDEDSWRDEYKYVEPDVSSFINEYSEGVRADYTQVMTATGDRTALFDTKEDFSQYKPRGHYTKNGILEAYFRAQMWYGRIHFTIAQSTNPENRRESLIMEPIALFIIDTVKDRPDLYTEWQALFDPITTLIGMSDDLGFTDVLPLWKEQGIADFKSWVSSTDNIYAIMNLFNEKLRPPLISGNEGVSDRQGNPPMGWRFMGQRFTYDSYVHQQVCAPRLYVRDLVRGLDVMRAFGSNVADHIFAQTDYIEPESENGGFQGGQELKRILDKNMAFFDSQNDDFWTETYYNNVLAQIRTQARFEAGAGYYFTESPLWNVKALNSAHSTWAELRHDTILYVKQVYAERAGGGDMDPTYRTLPLPVPASYIEPNLPFYSYSLRSVQKLYECFDSFGLLDDAAKSKLDGLVELYGKALEIATLESKDQPVTPEDNLWIRSVSKKLALLVKPGYDSYVDDADQLKMACIADVFTGSGSCLEVGVGVPYRLYVPLNDGQGGKRIAVGYVPSYYEFYGPQSNRMSDEEWKAIVYANPVKDMKDYEPFWIEGCLVGADAAQRTGASYAPVWTK